MVLVKSGGLKILTSYVSRAIPSIISRVIDFVIDSFFVCFLGLLLISFIINYVVLLF